MDPDQGVVLVTGSGFIGRALRERLAGHYSLVGFDRNLPPHPSPVAECVCIDLLGQQRRRGAGERLVSLIHPAAYFKLTANRVRNTDRLPFVARNGCCRLRFNGPAGFASARLGRSPQNGRLRNGRACLPADSGVR